jgi:probable H4MPT-linked C1 transfer pathway protein
MRTNNTCGWDVGGVNTKVARVVAGRVATVRVRPYELQRDPAALAPLLCELAREAGGGREDAHAVTLTAELSQYFRTKREGVAFVLDAFEAAFPGAPIRAYTTAGTFVDLATARRSPLTVAAANWHAAATLVARTVSNGILIDIGTTTTDIIPIVRGAVVASGLTDPARLRSGELLYLGAVRTPVEAITHDVQVAGSATGVSAEGFALSGDVHVWRGTLAPADYTEPTPDGRPATREFAAERLARVVCADREMLDESAIDGIANDIAAAQVRRTAHAIALVRARHPSLDVAVVTGVGDFIAAEAATRAGMAVRRLGDMIGAAAARCAPAAAVALLLSPQAAVDVVIKVGGSLLRDAAAYARVVDALGACPRHARVLVVPGGGPFADAVREADRRLAIGADEAHWLAIHAMDQHARLLASRIPHAVVVDGPSDIDIAFAADRLPVLAPSAWLRANDPLPHSWDVTSDSIAAWVAGCVGARALALVKAEVAGDGSVDSCVDGYVDPYFARAVPLGVDVSVVSPRGVGGVCERAHAVGGYPPGTTAITGSGADAHDIGADRVRRMQVFGSERTREGDGEADGMRGGHPTVDGVESHKLEQRAAGLVRGVEEHA